MCIFFLLQVAIILASTGGVASTATVVSAHEVDLGEPPTLVEDSDGVALIPDDAYDLINGEQRHGKVYEISLETGHDGSQIEVKAALLRAELLRGLALCCVGGADRSHGDAITVRQHKVCSPVVCSLSPER